MKLAGPALLCTLYLIGAAAAASASTGGSAGRPQPGDYCPFPKQDEKPACMIPAQQRYAEFFESVDTGHVSEIDEKPVARDLAGAGEGDIEDPYLALSSLAYAYYRLAERAAASLEPDPVLVARLEQWNRLFSAAYEASSPRSRFREALRRAAADLHQRAPAVPAACEGGGGSADCDTTGVLLLALEQLDEKHGFRGAVSRLLSRLLGRGDR
jgi:hypothetical protein